MNLRRLLLPLMLLSLCTFASCSRQMQRRIRIEGVESVERHGWSGADVTLRVSNDTRRDLTLDSCTVHVFSAGTSLAGPIHLGSLELRGGAAIARRTHASVRLRMKIRTESPAAAQAMWRRLSEGRTGELLVSAEAAARAGSRGRRISTGLLPLSSILNIFGVSDEDFSVLFNE